MALGLQERHEGISVTSSLFCTSGTSYNRCAIHLLNSADIVQIAAIVRCQSNQGCQRAKQPVQPLHACQKLPLLWTQRMTEKKTVSVQLHHRKTVPRNISPAEKL